MYLDNAATTRVLESVGKISCSYAFDNFYNASAIYSKGIENSKVLDNVREIIKKQLNATVGYVVFTSGATEANNLAILGSVRNKKEKYIFSEGEHPSVYNAALRLKELGHEVVFVKLTRDGFVDLNHLENILDETVRLISVIHVSNETGAINDIKAISKLKERKCKNALLHVDGVQAFCKIETNLAGQVVDFYSISGHKFHAAKGIGALYIKDKLKLKTTTYGGGQEFGLRSGTQPVPAIVGLGQAVVESDVKGNLPKMYALRSDVLQVLDKADIQVVGDISTQHSPYIVSAVFPGVNGETLVHACDAKQIYISQGSACSSKKAGNRILEAMNFSKNEILSSVRISFNRLDSSEKVLDAVCEIVEIYHSLKKRLAK